MQNVGAYGQEVSDVIARVRVLERASGALVWIDAADCGFGYRSSRFRGKDDRVVVEVEMRLARDPLGAPVRYAELARALGVGDGGRAPLARVRETVIALRRGKGMVLDPGDPESRSAGSFFTNPLVDPSLELDVRLHQRIPAILLDPLVEERTHARNAAGDGHEHAGADRGVPAARKVRKENPECRDAGELEQRELRHGAHRQEDALKHDAEHEEGQGRAG